ncbi:MAG TPA: methyl-accepting chemotaxis protein [Candidatus Limnocylindrales bacterium]
MRLNVRTKLLGSAAMLLAFGAVIATVGYVQLQSANDRAGTMYTDQLIGESQLSSMNQDVLSINSQAQLVPSTHDSNVLLVMDREISSLETDFQTQLAAAYVSDVDGKDRPTLDKIKASYTAWSSGLETEVMAGARSGDSTKAAGALSDLGPKYQTLTQTLSDADALKLATAKQYFEDGQAAADRSTLILFGTLVIAIVLGMLVALWLARSITKGVKAVQYTLTHMTDHCATALESGLAGLAQNDLSIEVEAVTQPIAKYGGDEIGQTAEVTNRMLAKLKATIASYEEARATLSDTVGQVKAAAEALARSSDQLNSAATQSGSASSQVAQTISQVAAGASDQAHAASQTSTASHDLTDIIERVGEGAASTRIRVQEASRALDATTRAITTAMNDSQQMAPLNERVQTALTAGAMAVDETAGGMKRIKSSVELTAVRVTELGTKSDQIGAIVETINDIAEQTNLLALNAAIEAARAGEQGKGFAVVADEVRKLAERSSRATKEIAALISEVQTGTQAAVSAMAVGAGEVETGAELAEQAAGALQEIRDAAAARNIVLEDMLSAVFEIRALSADVVTATDGISEIAEETNTAAAQMGAAADTVGRSVESIAAISQENSASAEEVSAATEEMSAQAEEVVASAATLAEMAQGLDELVARFRLSGGDPVAAGNIIPRRRATDWQINPGRQAESA